MKKPIMSIIVAIGSSRELGKDNKLLWHIPEDMKRFKQLTYGHLVIMGRTTYESIGSKLPGRINIIVSHNKNYIAEGCIVAHSLDEAIEVAKANETEEFFIIGGGQIYAQVMNLANKLYITVVDGNFEADTYFPDYSVFNKIIAKKEGQDKNYKYTFYDLSR